MKRKALAQAGAFLRLGAVSGQGEAPDELAHTVGVRRDGVNVLILRSDEMALLGRAL